MLPGGNRTEHCVAGGDGDRLEDLNDDPANTILLVEVVDSGVSSWAEPRDLDIRDMIVVRPGGPAPSSDHYGGGFNALFADGSVRYLDGNRLRAHLSSPDGVGDWRPAERRVRVLTGVRLDQRPTGSFRIWGNP